MTARSESRQSQHGQLARLRRRLRLLQKAEANHAKVEEALRRQALVLGQQAALLDLAHDTIMVRDLNNRVLFWNRGAEENYGWTKDEALGQVTHTLLSTRFPYSLPEIEADFMRDGRWEGELGHTRKDGTTLVVASRWVLRHDRDGRPADIMEINNDITARKQAEESLRQTLAELDQRVQERTGELVAANKALTEEIGERKRALQTLRAREKELRAKAQELSEVNSALQVLLRQQERYRADMEEQILDNVRTLILPYLENLLATHLNPDQRAHADILESNLRHLVSQFTRRLSAANLGLTPRELQIANLIRDGKTTKEMAALMHLSPRAIVFHRQNLRAKLGLKSNKVNLRSHLLALS